MRVGDEMLPGYMQYDRRLPLRTIDLPSDRSPAHADHSRVADGWFRGQTEARARATNGARSRLSGPSSMSTAPAHSSRTGLAVRHHHIIQADLIAGQREDRRLFSARVYLPGFDDSTWDRVVIADESDAPFAEYSAPPSAVSTVRPVALTEPRPGIHVVDFGQNINGGRASPTSALKAPRSRSPMASGSVPTATSPPIISWLTFLSCRHRCPPDRSML